MDDGPRRGDRMGRFELRDELGAGGMGTVFRAVDVELQREVAVKVLRPEVTGPEARVRITREAQAMAKLAHPNVVRVHELGDDDAGVYLVMELVEGQSLTSWLAEKARSVDEVVDVFLAAATGLSAAHDAGLVHRDFKPENVLVDRRGKVRVTDFGLVCVSGEKAVAQRDEQLDLLSLALTQTGAVVGTPRYMAPEQFLGKRVDARTDQFAFCVALYRALYGEAPFAGTKYGELMDAVIEGRVREVEQGNGKGEVRGVRDEVRAVVVRGLAADPEKRFSGMGELAAALKKARTRKRSWKAAAVAGMVAVAIAAAVVVAAGSSKPVAKATCAACGRLIEGGALVASDVIDVSAGPDERVAWTEKRGSMQVIVVRERNGRHEIMAAELAPAQLAFGPEGEQVAFRGKRGIFVMQSPSATPERLTDGDDRDPVWLDKERIAFTRRDRGVDRAMVATVAASEAPVVLAEGRRVLDAAGGSVLLGDGDRLSVLRDGREVAVEGVPAGARRARFAGASLVVATAREVWRLGATRERVYEGTVLDVAVTSDGRVMVVVQ